MKVLTVFAHPASRSFCHAVLERFDAGLREAGHTNEIVDLYAIGFDPILRPRDNPSWLTETIPDDMLDRMRLRESLWFSGINGDRTLAHGSAGSPIRLSALLTRAIRSPASRATLASSGERPSAAVASKPGNTRLKKQFMLLSPGQKVAC